MAKKIFYGLILLFIVIQVFQPSRNTSKANLPTDICNTYNIPDSIEQLLKTNCYDCHSNNTDYPWFINVQPIGWYMQSKISKGKKNINFSLFGSLSKEEAIHKLTQLQGAIDKDLMPIQAYTWYNPSAKLNGTQKAQIISWAERFKQALITNDTAGLYNHAVIPFANQAEE